MGWQPLILARNVKTKTVVDSHCNAVAGRLGGCGSHIVSRAQKQAASKYQVSDHLLT